MWVRVRIVLSYFGCTVGYGSYQSSQVILNGSNLPGLDINEYKMKYSIDNIEVSSPLN